MHVYTCISYTCFSLNIHFKVTVNGHSTALILVWFINCLFFPVLKRGWTLCRSLKAVSVCTAGLIRTHLFVFIQCLEAEVCIIVNDATLPSVGQNLQAHCPVGLLTWHYIVILIKTSVCSRPDKLLVCICKCPVSSLPPFGDFKKQVLGKPSITCTQEGAISPVFLLDLEWPIMKLQGRKTSPNPHLGHF